MKRWLNACARATAWAQRSRSHLNKLRLSDKSGSLFNLFEPDLFLNVLANHEINTYHLFVYAV